jgi:hypothetical protein
VYLSLFIAALAWFISGATTLQAQGLYKWVDSRGGIHYTNTPTTNTAKTVDNALPPAANFKSPTPPEPEKSAADATGENTPVPTSTPGETNPEQAKNATTPAEQPPVSDQQ